MKHLFQFHIYLGRLADRTNDEFLNQAEVESTVRPTMLRWFGGMHDMESTYICQMM